MKVIIEAQHVLTPHRRGIPVYAIQLTRRLLARKKFDYALTLFDKYKERGNRRCIDEFFGEYNTPIYECNSESYKTLFIDDSAYQNKSYNDYTGASGDIFHFLHIEAIPLKLNGKMIVTVHDVLPLIFPEFFPSYNRFINISWKRILEMKPTIIANSQTTKLDFMKHSGLNDIHVTPLGFDETVHYYENNPSILASLGINNPYLLYCGALDMRKNIIRILDAFEVIAKQFPEISLVLAGNVDSNGAPILQKIENHKFKSRIITLGFVSDEQKRILMSSALSFLFPSVYEGFGLPILEAMACGCPVITSNVSSMPEVAGNAAILIDPYNTEQLANEMERIITCKSLREELKEKGLEQCKKFSWDKTAEMTEDVYEIAYKAQNSHKKTELTYIWGAGYYGVLTAFDCEQKGIKIAGFIDSNASQIKTRLGLPVLILEQASLSTKPNVIIAIQNEKAIKEISENLKDHNLTFTISEIVRNQLWKTILSEKNEVKEAFTLIHGYDLWSSSESRSGGGSHIETTRNLRKALPELWKKYSIKTFLDAPCGDYNWMKEVNKDGIEYLGIDIVDELIESNKKYEDKNVKFKILDITKDELPKTDMIFCKDCLQHLSFENVHKALNNFKKSGSKYLLVTSYPLTKKNIDIKNGDYRPLNLFIEPFNLKNSLYELTEIHSYGVEIDKTIYLFELEKI